MTISRSVYNQLFEQAPSAAGKEQVIRLRPTEAKAGAIVVSAKNKIQMWTKDEHERFLVALEMFPSGPWKKVSDFIGTKTPRQTMTHAQKYRQKIHRRQRGLRNQKKSSNSSNSSNASTPNSPTATATASAPAPVDTKADVTVDQKTLVSPYGVADLQLKQDTPKSAEAAATNDQLLNILAQQATTMQQKSPTQQVETATNVTVDAAAADAQVSLNSSLPSLAEILHLGEANEKEKDVDQDVDMKEEEEEEKEPESKKEETQPTECKCSCKCGAHDAKKTETPVEETTPRSQLQEI